MSTNTSFRWIFWGAFLVLLDFSINGFDIFPDAIGYILVAVGAAGLIPLSTQFTTARSLAWLLAIAQIVAWFVSSGAATLFNFLFTLAYLAMFWTLLGGIIDISLAHRRPDFAQRTAKLRRAFTLFTLVSLLFGWFGSWLGIVALPFVFAIIAVSLVFSVLLLLLIRSARLALSTRASTMLPAAGAAAPV